MSRVFKPKAIVSKFGTKKPALKVEQKPKKLDLGVTLVEETPEKPRVLSASLSATGGSLSFGQPKFGFLPMNGNGKTVERLDPPSPLAPVDDADDDEEEWMMDSSPDIVLLNPSSKGHGDEMGEEEDEDDELMMATPSKPSRSGRAPKRRK